MTDRDFGANEIKFLLFMGLLAIALAWFISWAFLPIVQFIGGCGLMVGILIYGSFP